MKVSEYFIFSLRETPKDAESKSHIILTKGGYIKRLASGIYDFTPLGFKILKNVSRIIREEMERINCFEVLLPIMNPAEIWKETGRWYVYGKELIRFKDRNERDFCLAPTHEEIIVDLVRFAISSWRDLPFSLFQIGPKFRDEARPRFGIIRAREFIMKDAYSFDRTEEEAEKTYWKFYKAYERIFERMKLDVIPVQAAVGAIGGKFSHEFIFPTEYGEDKIMECQKCNFISKKEISSFFVNVDEKIANLKSKTSTIPPKSKVYTPSTTTVEELAKFLKIPTSKIIKSFFVKTESGKYYLCLVRGDRQISEDKLAKVLGENFELASEEDVRKIFGAGKGFIGPLKYKGKIIVDRTVLDCVDGVAGADEDDYHYINVVPGRDFPINEIYDIAYAEEGDICPECKEGILKEKIGLELGHVFYLGKKYSEPMGLTYTDKNKEKKFVVMGCYGIGVSRTVAALAEKFGDDTGVAFPPEVAPFKVHIIPINMKDEAILAAAEKIHAELEDISLLDDREDVSPGEKFADCDLWGAPIKIVIGKTLKEKGKIEIIDRLKKTKKEVEPEKSVEEIKKMISEI
jgi:prolyl-tRNA synthetase